MPSLIAPEINYLERTFERLRSRARLLLNQRVGTYRYRSFIQTDVVPAIIDVVAYFQEQNAHYYDRSRLNSLLNLADTRESMSPLTLAQGYRMRPATSASVAVLANPLPPQGAPITLRQGTRIVVGELTFEVAVDVTIPAGVTQWPDGSTDDQIVFVEGATRVDSFVSDGSEFQEFELSQPGTIDGSVRVTVLDEVWQEVASLVFVEGDQRGRDTFIGDGTDFQEITLTLLNAIVGLEDEDGIVLLVQPAGQLASAAERWQQVTTLTGAPKEFLVNQDPDGTTRLRFGEAVDGSAPLLGDSVDAHYIITGKQRRYSLTFDTEDRATIRFGDDLFGVIPPSGASVEVRFRTGGGVRGNVAINKIDQTLRGFLPNGARISVRVRNLENGSGGEPPESIEHARFFAPRVTRSRGRAVTQGDWTAHAATYLDPLYGAPAHASAFLKQDVPELNTVCVAVWARDETGLLTTPGTPLKLGIKKFLDTKRTITTVAEMKDGLIVFLDVEVDIVLVVGAVRDVVFAAVRTAITQHFLSAFVLPGVDVSVSRLYERIQDVEGVDHAEIAAITGSERVQLQIGTGDGLTKQFSFNLALKEGTTVLTQSVVVSDGTQQAIDDGAGGFTGDIDSALTNIINYVNGEGTVNFANPPAVGSFVLVEAKLGHFFAYVEDIGASDGTVNALNSGTKYYPLLKRAPRGKWSGDNVEVIDPFQVGTTAQMRGRLPRGTDGTATLGSITITDSTGAPQTGTDDGAGNITGPGIASGSVDYVNGDIDFTFNNPPVLPVTIMWTTRRMDIYVDADLLPLTPSRVFIWGGFSVDGVQPGGVELIAVDDGEGSIISDVLVGGTIDYATGRIQATWNVLTGPPPGPAGGASGTATLTPAPDGTTRQFALSAMGDLSRTGLAGEGRTRFQFSDLSTPGVTFVDAYDNWQGALHGDSLDREGANSVQYSLGTGTVTFLVPPAASAPASVVIQVTNVATLMVAGWVYRVPTPGGGLDKGLFSDNFGRLWGPPGSGSANAFPTDRLEHQRGQYIASLQGGAVPAGFGQFLTYDALTGVPPALDIPIAGDEVATLGRIILVEKAPESA